MSKINYPEDSKKFWDEHEKARKERNIKLSELTFQEKVDIMERLQLDYEILQGSKVETGKFGLGELPNASNEVSIEHTFIKADFVQTLHKVFPFTQELQGNRESSKT